MIYLIYSSLFITSGRDNTQKICICNHTTFIWLVSGVRRTCMCSGCGSPILDQFILRVAPDLEWHASCLKCADCGLMLEEMRTCFVRDGKTYCKMDYLRFDCRAVPRRQKISRLFVNCVYSVATNVSVIIHIQYSALKTQQLN